MTKEEMKKVWTEEQNELMKIYESMSRDIEYHLEMRDKCKEHNDKEMEQYHHGTLGALCYYKIQLESILYKEI